MTELERLTNEIKQTIDETTKIFIRMAEIRIEMDRLKSQRIELQKKMELIRTKINSISN